MASYQASLKDVAKTIDVIKRTEHAEVATADAEVIKRELAFIDAWLEKRAPEEVKFALVEKLSDLNDLTDAQKAFLKALGELVAVAPADADGEWFHKAVYDLKDSSGLTPKDMFGALYQAIIGKQSGPRAGYFLSILLNSLVSAGTISKMSPTIP